MNTNVAQPSLWAYSDLKPKLGQKQKQVLDGIRELGTACNLDLAMHLRLPVNRITGRVFELREQGLVKESHKDRCEQTGKTVTFWVAT